MGGSLAIWMNIGCSGNDTHLCRYTGDMLYMQADARYTRICREKL